MQRNAAVRRHVGVVLAGAALLAAAGCANSSATSSEASSGQALFEENCSVCHELTRATQAQKDRAGWVATVDRMRAHGAKVDDAQAAAIVDYLVSLNGGK